MSGFNGPLGVSFLEIESCLFEKMAGLFREAMSELLESLDGLLYEARSREKYKTKERTRVNVDTLLGTVGFSRRVYIDRRTGERVYALDEALGLGKGARVSPGLRQAAVMQAVDGPSYRSARDSLKTFYRHQVLSHESIRQYVLEVGKRIEEEVKRQRDNPRGDREIEVLLIEADGMWVSRQRSVKRETRLAISHEGWQPRSGANDEYELVNRSHCFGDGGERDFWEKASWELGSIYDLADTMVVINGDRAKWIRHGVEYFPKAMYQYDRFHLKRELRRLLREVPETCKVVLEALEGNRPREVLDLLREVKLKDPRARRELVSLRLDLEQNPDAMVDYRVRLKALGYDVTGMRGMGAAESNVNRFSRRLKKQGRSWGQRGLTAMIHAMAKRFEGTLETFTEQIDGAIDEVARVVDEGRLTAGARRIVGEIVNQTACALSGHMPALSAGRSSSGGLSWYFRRLNNALPSGIA